MRSTFFAASVVALWGCSGDPAPEVASSREPIVFGTVDSAHPSAVALVGQSTHPGGLLCSASIIEVDPPWAYLLTASHCVLGGAVGVIVGHLDAPEQELVVVESLANPDYQDGQYWHDYAVLRAIGADGSTPFTPAATASEDNLGVGDVVTLVGFGQTETPSTPNFARRTVDQAVFLSSNDSLEYQQTMGGMCFGDSGGPSYAALPAGERVVGIHSGVSSPSCTGHAYDTRVSDAYQSFIEPRIHKATFDFCGICFGSALQATPSCKPLLQACTTPSTPCYAYGQCHSACSGDPVCESNCATSHPVGAADQAAMLDCACQRCSPICDDAAACGGPETGCGVVSNDPGCDGCIQGCCAEAQACADDPYCGGAFPDAPGNPSAIALESCLAASQCLTTCGLVLPTSGAGGMGGGGDGGMGGVGGSGASNVGGQDDPAVGGGGGSSATGGAGGTLGDGGSNDDDLPRDPAGCSCQLPTRPGSRGGAWLLLALAIALRRVDATSRMLRQGTARARGRRRRCPAPRHLR
ncbi:MAG: trypsin-like serine protease [Myxococcales bacterium]|nr:trypsin-like serine protease [Myxococcales bacterium]